MPSPESERTRLLEIYAAAVDAVQGQPCVRAYLAQHMATRAQPGASPPRGVDRNPGGAGLRLTLSGPVYVIALGKAACSMARGAHDVLGGNIADAYVVTKEGYAEDLPWPCHTASHPLLDERSLAAGRGLLDFIAALPRDAEVLVLLSGGASALVESPAPGIGLAQLRAANEWLLASGLDIAQFNRLRKSLSLIKGGRLAATLAPRPVLCLAISDVPGDDPAIIASGPLVEDTQTGEPDIPGLPDFLRLALQNPPPRPPRDVFRSVHMEIIATLDQAKDTAAAAARRLGYRVTLHPALVTGDAAEAGARLAQPLCAAAAGDLHIWGGETTVRLPPSPGRGGRNQHLALAAALSLQACPDVLLLAAATDGSDGPGEDAGALVDGGTVARGALHGADAAAALAAADAGSFLAASGDLIATGPTGTNVMDIMVGLKY